jgi:hypothetical protein
MSDWHDILRSQNGLQPGSDFEERVFSKIKKKKRLRKISYGLTAAVSMVLLFSLLQIFLPANKATLHSGIKVPAMDKEEIPLHEDLFFSASDKRTRYSLGSVSFQKDPRNGDLAVNQI